MFGHEPRPCVSLARRSSMCRAFCCAMSGTIRARKAGRRLAAGGSRRCALIIPHHRSFCITHIHAVTDSFYRAGSLVFGGGHVVLPLLQAELVTTGWVRRIGSWLTMARRRPCPRPLFTIAAYLRAVLGSAPNGIMGATLAALALFLPGCLLLIGALPFLKGVRARPLAQSAMQGARAPLSLVFWGLCVMRRRSCSMESISVGSCRDCGIRRHEAGPAIPYPIIRSDMQPMSSSAGRAPRSC